MKFITLGATFVLSSISLICGIVDLVDRVNSGGDLGWMVFLFVSVGVGMPFLVFFLYERYVDYHYEGIEKLAEIDPGVDGSGWID